MSMLMSIFTSTDTIVGYKLNPGHFRSCSRPIRVLSDVPVSRNYENVSKLYQNSYIREINIYI